MATKSLTIFIDQFSDRIFDLGFDNVHLYDFGYFHETTWIDSPYDQAGYNTYDDWYFSETDNFGGFYSVTYDQDMSQMLGFDISTTNDWDYDLKNTTSSYDEFGYPTFYDTYYTFLRDNQTSDTLPNHGDWTLAAYLSQLENPEQNEIICIDVDTLNGFGSHYQKLFNLAPSLLDFNSVTGIESIIERFLLVNDSRYTNLSADDEYTISCLSVSIAGSPALQEIPTLDALRYYQVPVIQAAPNVNQGSYDWGSNYPDIINVGAWNVDAEGELLVSSVPTVNTLDILGNGLIVKDGWTSELGLNSNFGTSFATPKVAADVTNLVNQVITNLEAQNVSLSEAQSSLLNISYTELIDFLVGSVSEPIISVLDYFGDQIVYPWRVRSSDLSQSILPVEVDWTSGGLPGLTVASASLNSTNPVISSIPELVAEEDKLYEYQLIASDPDLNDIIAIDISSKPSWLEFDSVQNKLSGTPTQNQVGDHLVSIKVTDLSGASTDQVFTVSVANINDNPVGLPEITGLKIEGSTLAADISSLLDEDGYNAVNYQWKADGVPINAATGNTYTPTAAEVGKEISVEVSYLDNGNTFETVESATTDPILQKNYYSSLGVINTFVGESGLSTDAKILIWGQNIPTFWEALRYDIILKNEDDGATRSLLLQNLNDGQIIHNVEVLTEGLFYTVDHASYNNLLSSNSISSGTWEIESVAVYWDINEAYDTVSHSGPIVSGFIDIVDTWAPGSNQNISLGAAQHAIISSYGNFSLSSPQNLEPQGSVNVSGIFKQGETLVADTTSLSDADGLGTLNFQWTADGIDIEGATSNTLLLTQAQVGKNIAVIVSYTDDYNNSESISSIASEAVLNVNDDPVFSIETDLDILEDTPTDPRSFAATDIDGDELVYTFSTPSKGAIVLDHETENYIYNPNLNENGNDSFTIEVSDGVVTTAETVNITISAVNDAPILTTSNTITVDEETASTEIAFVATDADGDGLDYTFSTPSKGVITRDDENGTYVYTPNNGAIGSDSFDITVYDGTQTVTNTISVLIIDVIEGTNGSETIQGTDQSDLIRSFSGTDTIDGSLGDDEIEGGLGSKTFVFKNTDGDDVIRYFDGQKDTILINEVELSIALADESSGVTEQINQNGDRLIKYGSGDSILLLDERRTNPFEIIKVEDERWGSYLTYELRTKSDAAIQDIQDLSFKITWDADDQKLLTGSLEYYDLLANPNSVFDLDYLYNTDASLISVNRVPLVDDYENGYVTVDQFNQGLQEQFSAHPINGLSLTARANGDVDLGPSDPILKLMLDRDPTDIETYMRLSEVHYSQIETVTRVPNLADVQNNNVTQEQFEAEQPIPITREVDKNLWDNETIFATGDHLIGLQMKTKGNISAPNPLIYTANRSIGDGLSVRPIAKFKDVTKYEVALKISDPMVELTDLALPNENYEIKIQADFDISTFEIVGNSALNFTTEELEVMLEASSYLATDPSSAVAMTLETDAKKYQIWDELTLAQFSSGNEVSVKLDTSNLSLFDGSSGLKSGNYGILTFFAKNNKPDEVDVNFDAFATDSGASKLISSVAITSETVSARDLHSGSFNKSFLDGSEFYLLGDKWYSNPDHYTRAITASDALDVLKLSVGFPYTETEKVAGDFDLNGRTNAMDAYLILNYAANKNLSEMPRPEWRYSDNQDISSLLGVEGTRAQSWVENLVNAAESISATAILTGDVNGSYRPLWDDIDPLQDYIA